MPIQRDEEKVRLFKEELALYCRGILEIEIWFYDETGIEGDMKPRKVLCLKGSRPISRYVGNHMRENIMGAVNPKDGSLEALIMPTPNTERFQQFLEYFKKRTKNRQVIMVLDNASWHKVKRLDWGNIEPLYLPPYSPDLNPIERLWKVIKDRLYNPNPAKNHKELQDRIQVVLRHLFNNKTEVQSICKISF